MPAKWEPVRLFGKCGRTGAFARRAASSVFWMVLMMTMTSSAVTPALADRHCATVLDAYFRARQALLQSDLSCATKLEVSREELVEASSQAGICGCQSLKEILDEIFFESASEEHVQCEVRIAALLEFSGELSERVEQCN